MLGKLIKHNLRDTARIIPLALIAVAFFLILTKIGMLTGAQALAVFSGMFLVFVGFAVAYFIIGYCVFRFYKGVYGSEGYLTMTLPVTEKQVYTSWVVTGIIWILVGTATALVSYFVGMETLLTIRSHAESAAAAAEEINMVMSSGFKMIIFAGTLVGSVVMLLELYFCITIAHVKPFRKLGLGSAVLAYIALYAVHTIVSLLLTFLVPLSVQYTDGIGWQIVNVSMMSIMPDLMGSDPGGSVIIIGIAAFFWYLVPIIVWPVVTTWLMRKKINLK